MSTSTEDPSFALTDSFQNLPIELVLRIIDILALDLRDSEPAHARSLFLVSRTVRQDLLPVLYGLHSTIAKTEREFTGWDGRQYNHPALSTLSWLLCTPSAQPRRYIKDLIFCDYLYFHGSELQPSPSTNNSESDALLWSINNLIVLEPWDARQLSYAGIRARTAQRLEAVVTYPTSFSGTTASELVTLAANLWRAHPKGRSYIRLCTQPAGDFLDVAQEDYWHATSGRWAHAWLYQDLDPLRNYYGILEVPEESRGIFIYIDFGSSDGFGNLSVALLDEIALILENDSDTAFHVILVYPRGEQDIVIDGAVERLRAHCAAQGHGRLWVVRSSTDRKLIAENPHLEMARALQGGIDPWEKGRRVSEFVPEGKRQE